ncbi:MAG: hypothetical protein ACK5N9_10675, partial [Pirellula sp.]
MAFPDGIWKGRESLISVPTLEEAHSDEHGKYEEDKEANLRGFGVAEGGFSMDLTGLSIDQDTVGL